jgi:hypothetical protein
LISTGEVDTAVIIGVVIGIATLLFGGNHDDPADMPDKYDTARYTQYVGELQGVAATGYGPAYNPATDPIQVGLGGLSELSYIQKWISDNLNSSNTQVQDLAKQLQPLYGTSGTGQLSFDNDIADESVVGGSESGTYISIHNDAGNAISEIEVLDAVDSQSAAVPTATVSAPSTDYGNLAWVPFVTAEGSIGYWAPKGDGTYYYYGSDGVLYNDAYAGEVQSADKSANVVGNAATYNFAANSPQPISQPPTGSQGYGGVSY